MLVTSSGVGEWGESSLECISSLGGREGGRGGRLSSDDSVKYFSHIMSLILPNTGLCR